jgi:hypothetical protein
MTLLMITLKNKLQIMIIIYQKALDRKVNKIIKKFFT